MEMADVTDYVDKLVHPIAEIRERALGSLLQKVNFQLITCRRLAEHLDLLPNLLKVLDLGPHTLRKGVIELLQFTLKDEAAKERFVSLSGLQFLQSLKIVAPLDIVPAISHLLQQLQPSSNKSASGDLTNQYLFREPSRLAHVRFASDEAPGDSTSNESSFASIIINKNEGIAKSEVENVDDSCLCNSTEQELSPEIHGLPVTFTTFPWQALTSSDRRVLDSTTQSLLSHHEAVVVAALHFLDTVVLKDFPPEVFLQRPAVLQAVYGCIEEEGENAWRVQGPACTSLLTLTELLNIRVSHFMDPHLSPRCQQNMTPTSSGMATPCTDITRGSCCSSMGHRSENLREGEDITVRHKGDGQDLSGSLDSIVHLSSTTIHEVDDGDEFILLGMHQIAVTSHCVRVMNILCPLLISSRPAIQAASLRLLLSCLTLMRRCIEPEIIWRNDSDEHVLLEVIAGIKRIIQNLSHLLTISFECRQSARSSAEMEKCVFDANCVALLLSNIFKTFVPHEASNQVIDYDVVKGLVSVLCDGGFYLEYNEYHALLFDHLKKAKPTVAKQMESIWFVAEGLHATSDFLQTSTSQLEMFLNLAAKSLPVASIHQSSLYVEKLVRGLAKQAANGNMEVDQLEKMRQILLQVLSYPDSVLRLAGYKCVLKLVEGSIGISQAGDTSLSRSTRITILLSPSVFRFFTYSGLIDDNEEVVRITKDILLALFRGKPMMNYDVWTSAIDGWRKCLLDLQCLADSNSSLGRAVGNLPAEIYGSNRAEENFMILKFYLQCLYSKDKGMRIQALSHVVHRLAGEITTFIPDPREFQLTVHQDLLVSSQPIHLLLKGRIATETGRLTKVMDLIMNGGESEVQRAAWSQLAFMLEDPNLHQPFLQICSLQFLVMSFTGMLKREEAMDLTVDFVPGAVEVLRLLATHSQVIRESLSQNEEVLLCLIRVALIYYAEERVKGQASCLMALLVFDDIIQIDDIQSKKEDEMMLGGKDFVRVPELLPTRLYLPFLCNTYKWHEKPGFCEEMRCLYQVLQEEDWNVMNFLASVWASFCAGGLINLDDELGQAAVFSDNLKLSVEDIVELKSSVLKLTITKFLQNTQNATSHHEVKKNVNALGLSLLQRQLLWSEETDTLCTNEWNQSLNRFITGRPNSTVDEQLLTHVLNAVSTTLMVCRSSQKSGTAKYPPLIQLLIGELINQESALHQTLRVTGAVNWVASDPNPRALLSVRLFRSITNLIRQTLKYIDGFTSLEGQGNFCFDKLVESITSALLPVLRSNDELQNYNLAVLGCTLECVAHVTSIGWPGEDIACQLARGLIRLISTFHVGRGRAHNSYMGRMVTLSSSLALVHLLSHPVGNLTPDICSWNDEEEGDWSWLVSLWVYRDPVVTSAGLTVATSLTTQVDGTNLLHESLMQVSGGVWGAALSYLLASGRSCLVRTLAAQLLINLTEDIPTPNNPWRFPVVADTLTGESVEGIPALMVLLKHCNFYSVMYSTLAKLWIYKEQPAGNSQETPKAAWDLSLSRLSSFCAPADSDDIGGSQSEVGSEDGSRSALMLVSLELYETLLKLLTNILLLQPSQVILRLTSQGIISLVVKQLRYVVGFIKTSELHLQIVETALTFLCAVLKYDPAQVMPLARDTSLGHLTLVVLSSGSEKTSVNIVCLEVLTSLVWAGDWGAAHILEWIVLSPALILEPIVAALHGDAPLDLQTAAASFLISLLSSVYESDVTTNQHLESALASILDIPVNLLNEQDITPGWEICRHLIQLLCKTDNFPDTSDQASETGNVQIEPEQEHLFLECLKLLLLASQGAKEAAHHFRLSFIPYLMKPLSQLINKIQKINIHITTQLMNKKEIKDDVFVVIQHLELANNWLKGRGHWVETIGETFMPLLHQLWLPALRTPPLLQALLTFITTATAHHQACLFLTRTSGLPGVALSSTRTGRPLLSCITTSVCQQLARIQNYSRGSLTGFKDLPRERFIQAISILINCARIQECTLVMNKCDLVNALMKWLDSKMALEDGMAISPKTVKLMVVLTSHHETQVAVCKTYGWVGTFCDLIHQPILRVDALIIAANVSRNHLCAQALLSSEDILKTFIGIIAEMKEGKELRLVLIIVWSLVANNQRGQAILKQYPLIPLLRYLKGTQQEHADVCQKILNILDK